MFADLRLLDTIRASDQPVPEDQEQAWLFQWAKRNAEAMPELSLLFAIPNGGHRSKRQGALLKLTGVKAGVPDVFLPVARGGYHGLFIEMKARRKGARATQEQKDWIVALERQGYRALVCIGFEAARAAILDYLGVGHAQTSRGG